MGFFNKMERDVEFWSDHFEGDFHSKIEGDFNLFGDFFLFLFGFNGIFM